MNATQDTSFSSFLERDFLKEKVRNVQLENLNLVVANHDLRREVRRLKNQLEEIQRSDLFPVY